MGDILSFFTDPTHWEGTTGIPNRLFEHLVISGLSILVATLIAVPIGLYIGHTNRGSSLAINLANIGRAIPSYAMMVIPLPCDDLAGAGPRLRRRRSGWSSCRSSSR